MKNPKITIGQRCWWIEWGKLDDGRVAAINHVRPIIRAERKNGLYTYLNHPDYACSHDDAVQLCQKQIAYWQNEISKLVDEGD